MLNMELRSTGCVGKTSITHQRANDGDIRMGEDEDKIE